MVMAKAGAQRTCLREGCGIVFTPTNARQQYHDRACKTRALNPKRTKPCKQCRKPRGDSIFRRFCSYDCRVTYLEDRKHGRSVICEPIAVLLPLGSNPRRCAINPYAGEIPERRVFCRRYERCLSYAESQKWPGFACDQCNVNEPVLPNGWDKQ